MHWLNTHCPYNDFVAYMERDPVQTLQISLCNDEEPRTYCGHFSRQRKEIIPKQMLTSDGELHRTLSDVMKLTWCTLNSWDYATPSNCSTGTSAVSCMYRTCWAFVAIHLSARVRRTSQTIARLPVVPSKGQ